LTHSEPRAIPKIDSSGRRFPRKEILGGKIQRQKGKTQAEYMVLL